MKLVSRFELASLKENELHSLMRQAFNALVQSNSDSHERRNALASLENIQAELVSRAPAL